MESMRERIARAMYESFREQLVHMSTAMRPWEGLGQDERDHWLRFVDDALAMQAMIDAIAKSQ